MLGKIQMPIFTAHAIHRAKKLHSQTLQILTKIG